MKYIDIYYKSKNRCTLVSSYNLCATHVHEYSLYAMLDLFYELHTTVPYRMTVFK